MARIKRAVNAVKKRRKVFKLSKGYYGAKSKQYRAASQQVMRSMAYAYVGRKLKKREYRKLWIARINAGARICGTTYSRMIDGLKKAGVDVNRKVLADLAVNDMAAFKKLADDTVAAMVKSGEMAKLYDKWFMQPIPPKNAKVGLPASDATKAAWANLSDKPAEDYAKK